MLWGEELCGVLLSEECRPSAASFDVTAADVTELRTVASMQVHSLWWCSQRTHLSGCTHAAKGLLPPLASCAPCCRCQPWRRCWPSNQSFGRPLLAKPLPAVSAPPAGCQIPGRAQHRPPSAWVWPARLTAPAAIAPVPGCCSRLLSHMQPLPRTPAKCLQRHLRRVQHRAGPGQLQLAAGLGGPRTGLSCR